MRALILALVLAGCGERQVDALTKVKQRVCACKTVACAETAMKDVPQQDVKSTHRSQGLARDMLDCLAKLYDAQRPSTDPDDAPPQTGSAN
ncbi:MAG TPA: hypothetical protein VGG28_22130 [Kofleriaceae bacterium]